MSIFSFSKNEKLKSRKDISALFSEGKSIYKYPIKLYYNHGIDTVKLGVSVPKKNFKKAVTRNLLKRRLREAYRKNKNYLTGENYNIMLLYIAKEEEDFQKIESSIIYLLSSLANK